MPRPARRFRLRPVVRAERVVPTAQTLAKARGCIIRRLYEVGTIDGQEQDAALEIVEAFTVITGFLGIRPVNIDALPSGRAVMGARAARLWDRYVAWGNELLRRRRLRPHVVVEWLEMDRPLARRDETEMLVAALRDWSGR